MGASRHDKSRDRGKTAPDNGRHNPITTTGINNDQPAHAHHAYGQYLGAARDDPMRMPVAQGTTQARMVVKPAVKTVRGFGKCPQSHQQENRGRHDWQKHASDAKRHIDSAKGDQSPTNRGAKHRFGNRKCRAGSVAVGDLGVVAGEGVGFLAHDVMLS